MFDRYIIVDGSLRNVGDGNPTGYAIDTRIGYYRGLGLSMVDFDLEVDGEAVPKESITFQVHGHDYPADSLGDVLDDRWGFNEAATLIVDHPGGLPAGEHEVHYRQWLRISYLPTPSQNDDRKVMSVAG
ncbi:C-glycoside deglycosidase beta subunit domain-containing protein [Naasia aerilata]|uniref:C-deglycosylation enzyme beta subunit n=1 Tax=Naasia aerilata TaxID=1162966 RepID=A0ABN6XSE8_9MICO|nr:DUF6379 domain-containing protein [Naasia aerilata]BDZ44126.1 hypothetical protein GCM10025866_00350 [Naasia aerilata]BDZ47736.1 hypothetical protein GCM10025866_36450 [Naasia aerilata]